MHSILLATVALSSVASAHLVLTKPTPFVFQNPDYKRSPLNPDGSDYPCKKVNGQPLQSQGTNDVTVGQTYNLEWDNYVTHGGGSCQLSVTRDLDPTKDSVFKVIKTWEGGCPMASGGNNWAAPLPWQMPAEVQNGDAVMAWTWVPRLSLNPEIYMNCAPIKVSGGANDDSAFNQLPDLFIPNLQSSKCTTPTSGKNLMIPNAGRYVEKLGSEYGYNDANGGGCAGQASRPPGGGSSGASPKPAPTPPAPSAAPPKGDDSQLDLGTNRGFIGGNQQGAATGQQAAPAPVAAPAAQQSTPEVAGGATPVVAPGGVRSCSVDGAIVCGSDRQFGLCNFGKVEQWSQTADGTVCRDGEIKVSDDYAGKARRSIGSPKLRRHLAMHKRHAARSMAAGQ